MYLIIVIRVRYVISHHLKSKYRLHTYLARNRRVEMFTIIMILLKRKVNEDYED